MEKVVMTMRRRTIVKTKGMMGVKLKQRVALILRSSEIELWNKGHGLTTTRQLDE
jgi:hypothetical protein